MGKPKICISISASGAGQAVQAIRGVEPYEPDLVELRLDYMATVKGLKDIRRATDLPLIATNRRKDQGGLFLGSEESRIEVLMNAIDNGIDFVDLELTTTHLEQLSHEVRERGAKLIVSFHDFDGTPPIESLQKVLEEEKKGKPEFYKVICTAKSLDDNLTCLKFIQQNSNLSLVSFNMGEKGTLSRVMSPLFGGAFTYASADDSSETAPGQLTISSLRQIYRLLGV